MSGQETAWSKIWHFQRNVSDMVVLEKGAGERTRGDLWEWRDGVGMGKELISLGLRAWVS